MRRFSLVLALAVIAGCTAIQQQKAQTPKADNLEFQNLRVLSPNITRDELIATMRSYSRALGTRCDHCHVETTDANGKEVHDFASDAKHEKEVARTMMRMTRDMNAQYVSHVNEHGMTVTCAMCHRGRTVPEQWTPPAPAPRPAAEGGTATPPAPRP